MLYNVYIAVNIFVLVFGQCRHSFLLDMSPRVGFLSFMVDVCSTSKLLLNSFPERLCSLCPECPVAPVVLCPSSVVSL